MATARAVDGGCAEQCHGGGNAPWLPGIDEGKQRRCAAAFDGERQAPVADNVFDEALQHEADEGEVSGGSI
jgi:hypothetical protein